ncbi:hypothetical protein E1295_47255 [Nonomuraea mesophila]|uniref:Uncharacterized protein n=1 Tax=Nonomuraea mesophila TaxID=2530382 RepID=A0A4R5E288_9ACTN|nr:hypothetical protein [Nonomuraea mesophila]TDE20399.1 hypothetical protein E1295_47255 [Nonomuraea mesophila]
MPKLKSVIAGLALSTAMTGGVVGLGATSAEASTPVRSGPSVVTGDDGGWGWGWGHRRHHRHSCKRHGHHHGGWGWGHRRHHRGQICVVIRNDNRNENGERRHRHHNRGW